jgi:hypothetical protein
MYLLINLRRFIIFHWYCQEITRWTILACRLKITLCNINGVSVIKNLRQSFSHTRQYCVPLLLTFVQVTFDTRVLHLIQINHQTDTIFQFIILRFVYSSTCFGRFPAHHQELNDCSGSLWFYLRIVMTVVLCSLSGRPVTITTIRR